MTFRAIALLLYLVFPLSASAQSENFECKGQKPVKTEASLLERVQNAYASITSLQAKFIQNSYLSALETSELSSGDVLFAKPGQMKWHYTEPDEQDFVVLKDTVWFYQKTDNQVFIDDFKDVLISDLPVSFLMGLGDLKRDFSLTQACKNSEGLVLKMSPAKKNAQEGELESFRLLVNAESYLPIGAMVTDVSGNRTAIILSEFKLNQSLEVSAFNTDFGKGVDLIDRRGEKAHG